MATAKVPPLFRCPISLELMRDPVTLCTGITYDRSSIEKWIAEGNSTCPATMQSMRSTEMVPNLTLRSLIQSFCSSVEQQQQLKDAEVVVDGRVVRRLQAMIGKESRRGDLVLELQRVRKSLKQHEKVAMCPQLREELMEVVSSVLEECSPGSCSSDSSEIIQEAFGVILCLAPSTKNDDNIGRLIRSTTAILSSGSSSSEARIHAAAMVEKLASADWELKLHLGSSQPLLKALVQMLQCEQPDQLSKSRKRSSSSPGSSSITARASLEAMRSLAEHRKNRVRLVSAGAVHRIIELLPDLGSRSSTELGLCVLDMLCRSAEGRDSFAGHELGMFAVAKKMFRVSSAATEFAVGIMWSLCKYSSSETVMRKRAVDANAFERLLLLLHVDCSAVTKQQVYELLKLLRQMYSEEPCIIAAPDQALQAAVVPIYPRF